MVNWGDNGGWERIGGMSVEDKADVRARLRALAGKAFTAETRAQHQALRRLVARIDAYDQQHVKRPS